MKRTLEELKAFIAMPDDAEFLGIGIYEGGVLRAVYEAPDSPFRWTTNLEGGDCQLVITAPEIVIPAEMPPE